MLYSVQMPGTCVVIPTKNKGWILHHIASDLARLCDAKIIQIPQSRSELINNVKYKLNWSKKFDRYIFLHQSTFFKVKKQNGLSPNSKTIVFFTHQNSYEDSAVKDLRILGSANKIIVCAQSIKNFLIENLGDNYSEKIMVCLGGIDTKNFFDKGTRLIEKSVIFVSRLSNRKRADLIYRTIIDNPDYYFYLHGKNWEKSVFFEKMKACKNFEYWHFNYDNANLLYNKASIFLSLSDVEGAPMPALEALKAGCKVVLTDTGFASDLQLKYKCVVKVSTNPSSDVVTNALNQALALPVCSGSDPDLDFSYHKFLMEFIS